MKIMSMSPSLTEQQEGVEMSEKVRRLTQNSRRVEVHVLSHRRPPYSGSNEEEEEEEEEEEGRIHSLNRLILLPYPHP